MTFSPPCLTAEGGASPNRFEAKRFLLGTRNFLLHWSVHRDAPRQAIQQHLRSDTSTGSLYSQSGPTESCTKSKALYYPYGFGIPYEGETTKTGMPHQTKLVLRIDGFMHKQSFSMQPLTNCHGSDRSQSLHCSPALQFVCVNLVSGSADIIIVAHTDYDYGKRQSISSSANPAKFGTS